MSQRKKLLTIDYHSDDDNGMYSIGEIDFGINGNLDLYLKRYGIEGMNNILVKLSHLTWAVKDKYFDMVRNSEHVDCVGCKGA